MIAVDSSLLGREKAELDTPALLLDLDKFEANIRKMALYCRRHRTGWRPHSKAHKCPEIAHLQIEAGACGITCAKLSEAELMAERGIEEILIANQIATPAKWARLAALQRRARVVAALDNERIVAPMSETATAAGRSIPVLVEVDIGMDRTGASPGEATLELARAIESAPGLVFKGLMGYEGHVLDLHPPEEKIRVCHQALDLLLQSRDLLLHHGIPVEIVSAGGTGSYHITAAREGITEVQAGGGIFMDAMYREAFHVEELECALTVLATVTSRRRGHVVVDAGFKTMSSFHYPPRPLGIQDLSLRYLSAEHGVFDLAPECTGPQVGEQLEFIVGYSDSTTFMHDRFLGLRQGKVERVWSIAGRGLLS